MSFHPVNHAALLSSLASLTMHCTMAVVVLPYVNPCLYNTRLLTRIPPIACHARPCPGRARTARCPPPPCAASCRARRPGDAGPCPCPRPSLCPGAGPAPSRRPCACPWPIRRACKHTCSRAQPCQDLTRGRPWRLIITCSCPQACRCAPCPCRGPCPCSCGPRRCAQRPSP